MVIFVLIIAQFAQLIPTILGISGVHLRSVIR